MQRAPSSGQNNFQKPALRETTQGLPYFSLNSKNDSSHFPAIFQAI
jgi:hypothetical protein